MQYYKNIEKEGVILNAGWRNTKFITI
jgi:hypothetical protein